MEIGIRIRGGTYGPLVIGNLLLIKNRGKRTSNLDTMTYRFGIERKRISKNCNWYTNCMIILEKVRI